jgi:primosomal replication protein N''|tara:strand:+ start:231 stop:851 length:621 start_codon:yes stop_codon:yes gene_type:complete
VINEAQISRLLKVVEQLKQQANLTDKINSQNKAHTMIENNTLFSPSLFSTDSDCFRPYTDELELKVKSLSRLIEAKRLELSALALTKIEQQIQALFIALNANNTMHAEAKIRLEAKITSIKAREYKKAVQSVIQSSQELHQKLSQHHEYERRLLNMLNEKEYELSKCANSQRQATSQEVLTLHQRLGRCRKAISLIERDIEFTEKR